MFCSSYCRWLLDCETFVEVSPEGFPRNSRTAQNDETSAYARPGPRYNPKPTDVVQRAALEISRISEDKDNHDLLLYVSSYIPLGDFSPREKNCEIATEREVTKKGKNIIKRGEYTGKLYILRFGDLSLESIRKLSSPCLFELRCRSLNDRTLANSPSVYLHARDEMWKLGRRFLLQVFSTFACKTREETQRQTKVRLVDLVLRSRERKRERKKLCRNSRESRISADYEFSRDGIQGKKRNANENAQWSGKRGDTILGVGFYARTTPRYRG